MEWYMPRIKRWFPVSHDINADPEVWAMRREIGEKSLSIWLEFLSIADRNDGELPGDLNELIRLVAGRCQATVRTVSAVYQFSVSRLWLHCEPTLRVSKWLKYHKPREPIKIPSEPSEPSEPKNHKNDSPERPEMSVQDLVESWNENFKNKLPQVEWPLAESRHRKAAQRLKEHKSLDFWQRVFNNIATSSFLLGTGNGTWKCTIDFLINNDSNCIKIYEGAYSNGKSENRQQQFRR